MVHFMALNVILSFLFLVLQIIDGQGEMAFRGKIKQLEHSDKPDVVTIKTEHGDIYECVDFYKQPAFDHPALKNHNFHPQMRPSIRMRPMSSVQTFPEDSKPASIGFKDKSCPPGTVPIRRVNEDHLAQIESLTMNYTSKIGPQSIPLSPGTWVAISQTKSAGQVYHGVGANLTLHSPTMQDYEYTAGQIGIQGGPDSIQVGWTVNPILYKDMQTRMFIYTNAGQSHCFNTYCPGFVHVRADIPLDTVLSPVTQLEGPLYHFSFFIYQDPANGNWWLEAGHDYTVLGFWPKSIFTGLTESGSYVECGGQSYHPTNISGTPHMGAGFKPKMQLDRRALVSVAAHINAAQITRSFGQSLATSLDIMVHFTALNFMLIFLFLPHLQIIDGHGDTTFHGKMKQSEHLNKPAVETVKTEHGDIYECVDFYKQPAFDHPALKNHNFHPQMRPSIRMQPMQSEHAVPKDAKSASIGFKDKSCPVGTVPIRKVKEDHHHEQVESLMMNYTSRTDLVPGTFFAMGLTKPGVKQVYHGVGANLSLHSPIILSYEYTAGQIAIYGGTDSIFAGWMVNPKLYNDTTTRMFIYTNAGYFHCFNARCPGFVMVRPDIPLDSVLNPVTQLTGPIYHYSFFIYQDPSNGNWWLEVGPDYIPIGFWPKSIFTGLAESGSGVACGGVSYHPPNIAGTAHMGAGFRPNKHRNLNAYCLGFFVLNESRKVTIDTQTKGLTNLPESYGVVDEVVWGGFSHTDCTTGIGNSCVHLNGTNRHRQHRVIYGGTQVAS